MAAAAALKAASEARRCEEAAARAAKALERRSSSGAFEVKKAVAAASAHKEAERERRASLGADIDAATKRSHCRASWRDDEFLGECRSHYRPGKRMLAAAAADQENFHRMVLLSGAGRCGLPGAQYGIRLSCHERGPAA